MHYVIRRIDNGKYETDEDERDTVWNENIRRAYVWERKENAKDQQERFLKEGIKTIIETIHNVD